MDRLLAMVAAFSVLLLAAPVMAQGAVSANYTLAYANSTVSAAYAYVNTVNVSGYLIFQPNLTRSLTYLRMAQGNITTHPSLAVYYASRAQILAKQQYDQISQYRYLSVVIMIVVTVLLAVLLARIMRPVARKRRGRSSGAGNDG